MGRDVTRSHKSGDVRPHLFCPVGPTFLVTKIFFYGAFRCQSLPPNSQNTRGAFGRNARSRKYNSVCSINKRRTICVFKCWLNCQLASFEVLRSLEQTSNAATPSWSAVLFFCVLSHKTISGKFRDFQCFSCQIGRTCPVKDFLVSRNGAFFGPKKRPRTSLVMKMTMFTLNLIREFQGTRKPPR